MAGHEFKVNGIEFTSDNAKPTAEQLLEIAKEAAPPKAGDWTIEGDKGTYKPGDTVDLDEDNVFTAILEGPTPVSDSGAGSSIDRIRAELEEMGYDVVVRQDGDGENVAEFEYTVPAGSLKGQSVRIGIGMHGSGGYPEYPPHWIHLSPPVNDGQPTHGIYRTSDGREWSKMSRPPGDLWDTLGEKNMRSYLIHIDRFLGNL